MKTRQLLAACAIAMLPLLLASCGEKKNYYFTPTVDLNVSGGTSGAPASAIGSSSTSNYETYKGGAYWGDEGRSANSHYTPYGTKKDVDYNYYRGDGE